MAGRRVQKVSLNEVTLSNKNTYRLQILINNTLINENKTYFKLKNRQTEEEIIIHYILKEKKRNTTTVIVEFDIDKYIQMFSIDSNWDLSFFVQIDNELQTYRVKSNLTGIQYNAVYLSQYKMTLYPYSTNKGNFSFRVSDTHLFAILDSYELSKDGILVFDGHCYFSKFIQANDSQISDTRLVITNNQDDVEMHLPLELVALHHRKNASEEVDQQNLVNFKGKFDTKKFVSTGPKIYLKFYVELTFEIDGVQRSKRSLRLQCGDTIDSTKRKIIALQNGKYKLIIKPTKQMHYLSICISEYKFVKEVVDFVTSLWRKIRRSNLLKKLYEYVFYILGIVLPPKQNLIIFESFLGKQYSDNPRAIYEYMLEHHPQYEMYWSADRRHVHVFENIQVKYVRRFSIKWLLLMTRARYWVTNSRLPLWIPKPKQTIYLQTWHGTPLKRLAADMEEVHMPGTNTEKYKENFLKESSKWDYLVSPNAYSTEIFKRAFHFNKKVIESGYPRNDVLFTNNNDLAIKALKQKYNLPLDKKIILYAPTWRDNQFYVKGKYKFDLELDLQQMKKKLGDDYVLILRMHYLVAENLDLSSYEGFAYDFSLHEDIRELYLMADLLITDYSSVFFDYANLKRPMIFFVYDIDDYRDHLRGFYFDFERKAPGLLTKTTEEIIAEVKRIDRDGFTPTKEIEQFYDKFCYLEDGQATKRVVEVLFK